MLERGRTQSSVESLVSKDVECLPEFLVISACFDIVDSRQLLKLDCRLVHYDSGFAFFYRGGFMICIRLDGFYICRHSATK